MANAMEQIKLWRAKRDSKREWLWNLDTLVQLRTITNSFVFTNGKEVPGKPLLDALHYLGYGSQGEARRAHHPESIHPELGKGGLLDGALNFFLGEWAGTDVKQRSSFLLNVDQRLSTLVMGKHLVNADGVHWKMLEKGEDISCALYGKAVGFDLPETLHGDAGVAVSTFAKQRLYSDVERRAQNPKWREEGQTPLMFMMDEMHLLIGEKEAKLISVCRSLGLSMVGATQMFESLKAKLDDENEAELLLNLFQSFIALKTSARTYEYLTKRLGTAMVVRFPRPVLGIDYRGALETFAYSPLNDPTSFYASAMHRMKVAGAGRAEVRASHGHLYGSRNQGAGLGWAGHKTQRIDEDSMLTNFNVNTGGQLEEAPLVEPAEWKSLLTGPGEALIYLHRAGYERVDFAKLPQVGPDACRKLV